MSRRPSMVALVAALATAWSIGIARPSWAAVVGDYSTPLVTPLDAEQLARLRSLVGDDPEAAALAGEAADRAAPLLDAEPKPLAVIHYQGLLNTDPRRLATVERLRDMADVARLVRHWQASGDERAATALRRFTLAWTSTYRPTGNNVNENKFFPLLVAYEALRDTFDPGDREAVDRWVEGLGELHRGAVAESTHFTNRYTKHVRLLAICGRILGRPAWVEEAHAGVRRFVSQSLYADGSSLDLHRRDTLRYHGSALKPPLQLAILAGDAGRSLYAWTSPEGGSLRKSVDFLVPYATGEKTHREWVDSKVGLDRRRAETGLEKYRPGRLYDPQHALGVLELAAYFDPDLAPLVVRLSGSPAERFPTWQLLINAAARPAG